MSCLSLAKRIMQDELTNEELVECLNDPNVSVLLCHRQGTDQQVFFMQNVGKREISKKFSFQKGLINI